MRFEWDEAKNRSNIAKHGLSFFTALRIFEGPVLTAEDTRLDYGERREVSIGRVGNVLIVVVVHTQRQDRIRLISARRASRNERNRYEEALRQRGLR